MHGVLGDIQMLADLAIGFAGRQQGQDIHLAVGHRCAQHHFFGLAAGFTLVGHLTFAVCDALQGADHGVAADRFGNEAGGAGGHRAFDILLPF